VEISDVKYSDDYVFDIYETLLSSVPAVKHVAFFKDQLTLFIYCY